MLFTHAGELPRHLDCWVDDRAVLREPAGKMLPCRWFGLVSHPGRVWGCTVLLENGAVYRGIPPHRMAFSTDPVEGWNVEASQRWNCYSRQFTTIEYTALAGLSCVARCDNTDFFGRYLFTAAPFGDGYTETPEQGKEYCFVQLDNGRLTIQPTDKVLFSDRSWTTHGGEWPQGLRASDTVIRCE